MAQVSDNKLNFIDRLLSLILLQEKSEGTETPLAGIKSIRSQNEFLSGRISGATRYRVKNYVRTPVVSDILESNNKLIFQKSHLTPRKNRSYIYDCNLQKLIINNHNLYAQLEKAYLLDENFKDLPSANINFEKLGNPVLSRIKKNIDGLNTFQKNVGLNDKQMKFLIDTYIDIVYKYKVDVNNIHFDSFEEDGEQFNSIIFYTISDDVNLLVDMKFELVETIAKNPEFIGKRFAPSFEHFGNEEYHGDNGYVSK